MPQRNAIGPLAGMEYSTLRDQAKNELVEGFRSRTENALKPFTNASDAADRAYRDAVDAGVDPTAARGLVLRATSDLSSRAYLEGFGIPAGIIAGAKGAAQLANAGQRLPQKTYDAAQAMERRGITPEDIHGATGWWRGADGKWRFEIDDSKAALKNMESHVFSDGIELVGPPLSGPNRNKLIDHLEHPNLYKAYPEAVNTELYRVPSDRNFLGAYNEWQNALYLAKGQPEAVRSTMMHEVQHKIQALEGFARGGNIEQFIDRAKWPQQYVRVLRDTEQTHRNKLQKTGLNSDQVNQILQKPKAELRPYEWNILDKVKAKFTQEELDDMLRVFQDASKYDKQEGLARYKYENLAGEAEAQLVQQRLNMTPAERAQSYPGRQEHSAQLFQGPDGQPYRLVPVDHNPFE